jgi:hypothetical protein
MQDDDVPAKPWSLSEEDLRLAKESGFDISAFTPESAYSREGYRRVKPEDSSVDLSDFGRSITSGAAGLGAGAGALTSWATNGYLGDDTRKYFNDIAQDQTERMGPRSRRAASSEVFPDEGKQSIFDDFLPALGLKTAAALPSTVASIIPGGIAARVLSGASMATRAAAAGAVARGSNAVMNGGDVANQIYSEIDKMPDDELRKQSPLYAGYRSAMSEKEARSRYMSEVAGAAPVLGMIVGAATPGVENMIAGRLAGQTATGVVKGAAKGAKAEASQGLIENSTGEIFSQQALIAAGLKSQMDWEKVLSQGIEGALVDAVMGGTTGGVSNIGGAKPAAQPKNGVSINQTDVDPDHAAALKSKQGETALTEKSNEGETAQTELNNPVPEDPETLKLQQEKLVAGEVEAMLFTPGTEELAVPEGFARYDPKDIKDPELREKAEKLGIFHYDPSLLPTKAIDQAIRNDRVNELLGYNQSKEEVVAKQQQGVPPAAVVERAPDGTEVRGAIASADQVRDQANRFQQQATPGNTVGVENVDSVVQARQAAAPNEVGDALERRRQAEREEDDRLYKQLGNERDRKAAAELADYDDAWYDYQAEKRLAAERDAQAPQTPPQSSIDPFAAQEAEIRQGYKDFYEGTPEPEPPKQPDKALSARAVAEQRAAQKAEKARIKETAKAEKALATAREREAKAAKKQQEQAAKAKEAAQQRKANKAQKTEKAKEVATQREAEKPAEKPMLPATQPQQKIASDLFTAEVKMAPSTEVAVEPPKKLAKFWVDRAVSQANSETINPETGKHWTKAELAQRERVSNAAQAAFVAHPPGPDELYNGPEQSGLNFSGRKKEAPSPFIQTPKQGLALRKRLAAMVAMVEKAGKIPQAIYGTSSDHLAFLRQAKDALEHYAGKDSKEARAKMNDFIADEMAARKGDFEPLRKRRLQEGDQAKRQNQGDVEAITGDTTKDRGRRLVEATSTADPETILEQADEAMRRDMAMQEIERQLNEHGEINDIAALEKIMGKKSADMATIYKILSNSSDIEEGGVSPYEARLRQHIAEIMENREKQERAKNRSTFENSQVKEAERMANDRTRASHRLAQYQRDVAVYGSEASENGNGNTVIKTDKGEAEAIDSSTIANMLHEDKSFFIDGEYKLARAIADMAIKLAGKTNIHILSDGDYDRLYGKSGGVYTGRFIVLPKRSLLSPDRMRHVVLHEAVHAALTTKILGDPLAISQIKAIAREVLSQNPALGEQYAFANAQEFVAEALSNKAFQRTLAQTELSPGLAEQLGLGGQEWQGKTQWWGLVNKFAEWLGFKRNPQMVDALNAVLSVTDRLAEGRAPDYQNRHWQTYFPPEYSRIADRLALSPQKQGAEKITLPANLYLTTDELLDGGKDRASAFKNFMRRAAVKGATLDQLRQMAQGLFTDAKGDALERVVAGIQRMAPYAQSKREAAEKLAQRFINYRNANSGGADKLSSLAIDATMANVKLGPNADNKHLVKGWRGWQGSEQLAELQSRFNKELDAEGKQLYQDMASFYSAQQNEMTKGLIENILKEADINPKDRNAFIQRVMTGTMTNADDTLLKDKPTVLKGLKDATELRSIQGDYFPLMRNGDYVVTTKNNIKDTGAGKEIEPGKVEFRGKSRQEAMKLAEAWAKQSSLPVLSVQPSKDTSTSTDFGVVVNVQRDGAHFFENEAEAFKWRRQNQDQFDQISQVQDRRTTALQSADLTTTQFNMLKGSIERQTNASDEVKQMMHAVVQQAAARMMNGNRVQQRSIARRNVAGASKDFGRTLIQYGQATSGYLAKIKYMPEIREALNSMSELAYDDMSTQAPARVRVLNEVKARIDQNVVTPNEGPVWLKDLMGLTFLGKLFSPMYSVINGMQPWMVTMPVLAGRYGAMRANAALASAYSSLGFTDAMVGGFRNSYLAGKQWSSAGLLDTTDIVGSIKKKLSAQQDGAQLSKLIDLLQERGAMSSGGFEMAQALSEGRGAFGTTLSKVDRIARQLPQAVEDINRASSAIAAYRLARASGMNEEKASAYAFDVVMNTQGDYSAVNAPRFFANSYLRPALQFKKYAQMMAYLLADMAHKSFAGATPQERAQARKALANVFAVQVAMAGALSLPGLEIVKLGFMIAAVFGVGQGWDDQEERLRKLAEDSMGKKWGELVSKGIISRAIGIDISQRVSLSDMFIFGEPKKYDKENLQGYFAQTLLGAPGSTAFDFIQGWQEIQNGEPWEKGASKMIPIKFVADALKAKNNYDEGKSTAGEVALNIFGAKSGRQSEAGRTIGDSIRKRDDMLANRQQLQRAYLRPSTKPGELAILRGRIAEFNKTAPFQQKLFPNSLDKIREKQKLETQQLRGTN